MGIGSLAAKKRRENDDKKWSVPSQAGHPLPLYWSNHILCAVNVMQAIKSAK